MKRSTEAEESIEQMFAEVGAHLVEAEEILLPSLEAKVLDVRSLCQKAHEVSGSALSANCSYHIPGSSLYFTFSVYSAYPAKPSINIWSSRYVR